MFALTILLVQANARSTIREYTLRGQLVSDFIRYYFLFIGVYLNRLVISPKMSSLTHSEAEKLLSQSITDKKLKETTQNIMKYYE